LPQTTSAVRQTGHWELEAALMIETRRLWRLPRFSECSDIASFTEALD
jgi:hypothetical protein